MTELMLVAIDWSGRSDDRGRTTWMAVIDDGVFGVLENGRSRAEVREELVRLRRKSDRLFTRPVVVAVTQGSDHAEAVKVGTAVP